MQKKKRILLHCLVSVRRRLKTSGETTTKTKSDCLTLKRKASTTLGCPPTKQAAQMDLHVNTSSMEEIIDSLESKINRLLGSVHLSV